MILLSPEPLRVVIVDDDKDARDSLARLLELSAFPTAALLTRRDSQNFLYARKVGSYDK